MRWLTTFLVCFSSLLADEPKVCSPIQQEIAAEWKFLSSLPEIKDPEKELRPGDVMVYLLPPEEVDPKDLRIILMSHKIHASLVMRNEEGTLGRLESPPILGNRFLPMKTGMPVPYVAIRPKYEGPLAEKFSSRAAFENEINRAAILLEASQYAFGSDLVFEVLDPKHRKALQKSYQDQCIKEGVVQKQTCSELPLTALTMVGLETHQGVPIREFLPRIQALLKQYPEKEQDAFIEEISQDFVEEMTGEGQRQLKLLAMELEEINRDLSREKDRERILALQKRRTENRKNQIAKNFELAAVEQTRKLYVTAVKKKVRTGTLTPAEDALFDKKIIRPHDLLSTAGPNWKFEIVGFSANGYKCAGGVNPGAADPVRH